MKRSPFIELVLIGSSLVSLQACNSHKPAQFSSKEECEKAYGKDKCGVSPEHRHFSGGSLFVPLMIGRAAGMMMGGSSLSPPRAAQPAVSRGGFGATGNNFGFGGG